MFPLQFRVRHIFFVLTTVAIWLGIQSHRSRTQAAAVSAIRALGGAVFYTCDPKPSLESQTPPNEMSPIAKLLVSLFPKDFLYTVHSAVFFDVRINDDDLRHLESLPNLRLLFLSGTDITDDGLRHLQPLTNLEVLNLSGSKIRGPGIQHLRNLSKLRYLELANMPVSDCAVEYLLELDSIESLLINGTDLSEHAIAQLRRARPNCELFQ